MIKNQYMHEQVHELLFWMSLSVWPSVSELNIPVSGKSNIEGSNKVYGMNYKKLYFIKYSSKW